MVFLENQKEGIGSHGPMAPKFLSKFWPTPAWLHRVLFSGRGLVEGFPNPGNCPRGRMKWTICPFGVFPSYIVMFAQFEANSLGFSLVLQAFGVLEPKVTVCTSRPLNDPAYSPRNLILEWKEPARLGHSDSEGVKQTKVQNRIPFFLPNSEERGI